MQKITSKEKEIIKNNSDILYFFFTFTCAVLRTILINRPNLRVIFVRNTGSGGGGGKDLGKLVVETAKTAIVPRIYVHQYRTPLPKKTQPGVSDNEPVAYKHGHPQVNSPFVGWYLQKMNHPTNSLASGITHKIPDAKTIAKEKMTIIDKMPAGKDEFGKQQYVVAIEIDGKSQLANAEKIVRPDITKRIASDKEAEDNCVSVLYSLVDYARAKSSAAGDIYRQKVEETSKRNDALLEKNRKYLKSKNTNNNKNIDLDEND